MICWRMTLNNTSQLLATARSHCVVVPRRWKKKKMKYKKPGTANRSDPSYLALRYFDETYRVHFGNHWPIIRVGLLSPHKYGALLNNYSARAESIEVERLRKFGGVDMVEEAARRIQASDVKDVVGVVEEDLKAMVSNFQEMGRIAAQQANNQDVDQTQPSHEENLETLSSVDNTDTEPETLPPERKSAEQKQWWEDQYIIAPGFESKMEGLIQGGGFHSSQESQESQPSAHPASDIGIIKSPMKLNPNLRCFVHQDEGNVKRFPSIKSDSSTGLLSYYAMDAASILPVLALDLRPEETVLDLCAGPGGKALAMLQTMCLDGLHANEPIKSRRQRLRDVLASYIPISEIKSGIVSVSGEDGQELGEVQPSSYDKVLVDVPCTTDRRSAQSQTDNIFNLYRVKERQRLPQLQRNLLCSALQAVKPGGDVVYSTCTLSQLQNDDVIENAIYTCRSQYKIKAKVVDLSPLTSALDSVFNFWQNCTYGQLVIPGVRRNFGPMYFCKLRRVK